MKNFCGDIRFNPKCISKNCLFHAVSFTREHMRKGMAAKDFWEANGYSLKDQEEIKANL